MSLRLQYVLDKIDRAPIEREPFEHVFIRDLLDVADFDALTASPEIRLPVHRDDAALIADLHARGYCAINFPGTTSDIERYLAGRHDRSVVADVTSDTCESFGMTFRLNAARSTIVEDVMALLRNQDLWDILIRKFQIEESNIYYDAGIQKYLDGYEISPHPDVRKKALTFMTNINPAINSSELDFHTCYMKFRPEYEYVAQFWEDNPNAERAWVPWSWCETIKQQVLNNSMVIFRPSNTSIHAVKASYDHLKTQRTQLYGNIWRSDEKTEYKPSWTDIEALRRSL